MFVTRDILKPVSICALLGGPVPVKPPEQRLSVLLHGPIAQSLRSRPLREFSARSIGGCTDVEESCDSCSTVRRLP